MGWTYEGFVRALETPGCKYLDEPPVEWIRRYAEELADERTSELLALIKKIDAFLEHPRIVFVGRGSLLDVPHDIAAGVKAALVDVALKQGRAACAQCGLGKHEGPCDTKKRNRVCGFWTAGVPCPEQEPCPRHGTMPSKMGGA